MAKRAFDIALILLFLPLIVPVMLVVALAVAAMLGRPILFAQQRPGKEGRLFTLRKFRSMSDARDANGALRDDSARLGRFGRFLRASSLDELPELFNVLRGEMSLVGPRPLLPEYLPLYSPEQARRHEVRPGLTGWAQIKGRNALDWESKFALDVWYVDNRSLWLDVKILILSVLQVLRRDNVDAPGQVGMTRFTGN